MKSGLKILNYTFLKIIVIGFPNPAEASSSEASHSSEATTDSAQSVSGD